MAKNTYIKCNEGEHKTKVPPVVRILDVETSGEELVCCAERAELATASSVRVRDVSTSRIHIWREILRACLTRRRVQLH